MVTRALKIQDYGLIGNGRSAALVGINGSIDWLCWPRFDSPSLFGAILDYNKGGFWKISPRKYLAVKRNYIKDTNILETHFQSKSGKITLTDFMAVYHEEQKAKELIPEHELVRMVSCVEGEMEVEITFSPRPDYGRKLPNFSDKGKFGLRIEVGRHLFSLHSEIRFKINENNATAIVRIKAGDRLNFLLTYNCEAPAVCPPPAPSHFFHKLEKTKNWWKEWCDRAEYKGSYRDEVIRSALVLKLLNFAPSGAFVAAPTMSLPEKLNGTFNWDYRYCWLRDASWVVRALMGLGYKEEARAFVSWMLHSTRLTLPKLRVVYDVYGDSIPAEWILKNFSGYKNSQPVRVSNEAQNQMQLDIYGEVIDGVYHYISQGESIDIETQRMIGKIGDYICKNWRNKDSGIWEEKDDIAHYTYSKLLCWVALDRLLNLGNKCQLTSKQIKTFTLNKEKLRKEIENYGWNTTLNAYTAKLNGRHLDASLLLIPFFKFDHPSSPYMQGTFYAIDKQLNAGQGLLYRDEKRVNKEGAFLLCSFWKIDFLLRWGKIDEAKSLFEQCMRYSNDLQLFAEETDPETGDALGNFPQAFTHLGLINIALLLERENL